MRADRLVAILLMLQRRGQVTAAEVAGELEVSERTARRDLDSLGVAGVPVYSTQGRGGGWRLAGGGRTDLSGLSAPEVRALFMVAGPQTATPEVRAALRKLVRALPEPLRDHAEAASQAVIVDDRRWGQRSNQRPQPTYLTELQDAVIEARQVELGYADRSGAPSVRIVEPYGIVAKGPYWYLVAGTGAGQRTFRIDRVVSVMVTETPVARPPGFDLDTAWRQISDQIEDTRLPARARVRIDPALVRVVRWQFADHLSIAAADASGWVEGELRGHSDRALAGEIARFGSAIEVLDPPTLRHALAEIGRQLVSTYG